MHFGTTLLTTGLSALVCVCAGCHRVSEISPDAAPDGDTDADDDTSTDADTDSDGETDSDSGSESDSDSDTGDDTEVDTECNGVPWDETWTYGEDYAAGPYGFKGSMCWNFDEGTGTWTIWGDTIPDICLPNQNDTEICLDYYLYDEAHDLIFLSYSATWCPTCQWTAEGEQLFLDALADNGWSARWIHVIGEPDNPDDAPTVADAAEWVSQFDLGDDPQVLYDADGTWYAPVFDDKWPTEERGWPMIFVSLGSL